MRILFSALLFCASTAFAVCPHIDGQGMTLTPNGHKYGFQECAREGNSQPVILHYWLAKEVADEPLSLPSPGKKAYDITEEEYHALTGDFFLDGMTGDVMAEFILARPKHTEIDLLDQLPPNEGNPIGHEKIPEERTI